MAIYKLNSEEIEKVNGGYIYNVSGDPDYNFTYQVINDYDGSYISAGSTYWTRVGAIEVAKEVGVSTKEISKYDLFYLKNFHKLPE